VVALAATLSSCAPPAPSASAAAITNSTPDDGDAHVVALLEGSTLLCTATLIAPRVLLTAAHCVPDGSPAPQVFFGADPATDATRASVIDVQRHPAFDDTTKANDLALLLLAAPATVTPANLPSAAPTVGLALRLVGFGRTSATDTAPARKRSGTSQIAGLSDTELTFAPMPSQTCEGDSGGPAFATVGGVEALVGVTSTGDPQCTQSARDIRVDAYATSFIAPYLAATTEGAAGAGDRCYYDANCAAGTCAPALDEPRRSYCAPSCDAGCPAGLTCLADANGARLCRHPSPSPGALGAPCGANGDCVDGQCASAAAGGPAVCTRTCFPDLPGFCPSGTSCAATTTGTDACFAPRASGCSYAGRTSAPAWPLLFLLIAAPARLARRRR
jgi:hypothetical protein